MKNDEKDENSIKELLENINNTLLKRYDNTSTSFTRLFYILIGSSLFFLLFFLIPYLSIQYESQYSFNLMNIPAESIIPSLATNDAYLKSQMGYHQFLEQFKQTANELKDFIQNILINTNKPGFKPRSLSYFSI